MNSDNSDWTQSNHINMWPKNFQFSFGFKILIIRKGFYKKNKKRTKKKRRLLPFVLASVTQAWVTRTIYTHTLPPIFSQQIHSSLLVSSFEFLISHFRFFIHHLWSKFVYYRNHNVNQGGKKREGLSLLSVQRSSLESCIHAEISTTQVQLQKNWN